LYFGHEGFLDLASTKPCQFGFVVNERSVFNEAFSQALNLRYVPAALALYDVGLQDEARDQYVQALDADGDERVSWPEFTTHLQGRMNAVYQAGLSSMKGSTEKEYQQMVAQGRQELLVFEYPRLRGK
jgi:hypothetical protein